MLAEGIVLLPGSRSEEGLAASIHQITQLAKEFFDGGFSLFVRQTCVVTIFTSREIPLHAFTAFAFAEVFNECQHQLTIAEDTFWIICAGMRPEFDCSELVERYQI